MRKRNNPGPREPPHSIARNRTVVNTDDLRCIGLKNHQIYMKNVSAYSVETYLVKDLPIYFFSMSVM